MTERRIKSVKWAAGGRTEIAAIETWDGGTNEREWTLRCYDEPAKALPDAFAALEAHVRDLLDLPRTWAEGQFKVTKVTWSWNQDAGVKGAVVTCLAYLPCAHSPIVLNTPHLPYEPYNRTDDPASAKLMPEDMVDALDALERAATAYLDGQRSQGDLFAPRRTAQSPIEKATDEIVKRAQEIIEEALS